MVHTCFGISQSWLRVGSQITAEPFTMMIPKGAARHDAGYVYHGLRIMVGYNPATRPAPCNEVRQRAMQQRGPGEQFMTHGSATV
jgi:hypothetical protein